MHTPVNASPVPSRAPEHGAIERNPFRDEPDCEGPQDGAIARTQLGDVVAQASSRWLFQDSEIPKATPTP